MVLAAERFGIGNEANVIVGADLASAATVAPTHKIHVVTGSTAITTITAPNSGAFDGDVILIAGPTAATDILRWGTGGNILGSGAVPSGQAVTFSYNRITAKWMPQAPNSGNFSVVNLAAATQSVNASQAGQTFIGAVDAVFTLPAASAANKGIKFTFMCGVASGGTGLVVRPVAADGIGGYGLTGVVDKDLINTGATDVVGDLVEVTSTGAAGAFAWYITKGIGIWAKEA